MPLNDTKPLATQALRLIRYKPQRRANRRLFCFPYAGGGLSVFQQWPDLLPIDIDVCSIELPGRGMRLGQPALTEMPILIERIMPTLASHLELPFALFGHSMGSLVAFELARALRRGGLPGPAILFVSGHRAAHLPDTRPLIHLLPDAEFLCEMQKQCDTPEEFLSNKELVELFIPMLRADFQLCETYRYAPEAPLDCPIVAFGGDSDNTVKMEELNAWRELTSQSFSLQIMPGGHLFIQTAAPALLRALDESFRKL